MAGKKQKSKKILEISSYPPPRAGWGGRVAFVKEALIEAGHICEVINIAPESRKIPSPEYLTSMNGLDYIWKVFTRSIRGYRVHMHLNGNSPKGFILTLLAEAVNLITFKRPVLTVHAGPCQLYFPKERAPHLIPMFKFIFGVAKKIICNSKAVKEKIVEYGINPDKIVPIQAFSRQYLQFSPVQFNGSLQSFMESKDLLISSYVFFRPEFFIDRMVKGIAELVKKYPNLGLMILGSDDNSKEIRKLVEELDISGFVYFTGDLDHDSFLSLVSGSHIFLRTPIRDGISSSVLEALALNVPVVASENGHRPESVITYDHEDIADMVRVLGKTIENLPEIKRRVVKPQIRDTVADEVIVLTED
jgi:glycosyltransferase involved in cell wall biosynthesis